MLHRLNVQDSKVHFPTHLHVCQVELGTTTLSGHHCCLQTPNATASRKRLSQIVPEKAQTNTGHECTKRVRVCTGGL